MNVIQPILIPFLMKDFVAFGLAILSSSCCIIQLIFNYFSLSCAGFAVLTPYRLEFSLLVLPFLFTQLKNRKYTQLLLTILIMLSQDIVSFYNNFKHNQPGKCFNKYDYKLDGMKCEGCANRVKNSLEQLYPKVAVDFSTKTIHLWNNLDAAIDDTALSKALFALDFNYKPVLIGHQIDCD